jgi:hypothetical protein
LPPLEIRPKFKPSRALEGLFRLFYGQTAPLSQPPIKFCPDASHFNTWALSPHKLYNPSEWHIHLFAKEVAPCSFNHRPFVHRRTLIAP